MQLLWHDDPYGAEDFVALVSGCSIVVFSVLCIWSDCPMGDGLRVSHQWFGNYRGRLRWRGKCDIVGGYWDIVWCAVRLSVYISWTMYNLIILEFRVVFDCQSVCVTI